MAWIQNPADATGKKALKCKCTDDEKCAWCIGRIAGFQPQREAGRRKVRAWRRVGGQDVPCERCGKELQWGRNLCVRPSDEAILCHGCIRARSSVSVGGDHGTLRKGETGCKCSECKRARRDYSLRHKYGISLGQYEALAASQEHLCAICRQPTEKLFVDHCHETQEVRGLLCSPCNTGIGHLKDDPSRLRNAYSYLTGEEMW